MYESLVALVLTRAAKLALVGCTLVVMSACSNSGQPADKTYGADYVINADWDTTRARGQTREIDFETSEGTWTAIDVSPDGEWLIFDLLGHIYRLAAEGGEAVSLTQDSGVALNQHPSISPDGTLIAFSSDRSGQDALWVMDPDGSNPKQIFMDPMGRITHPTFAPDSKSIYAVRHFRTGLGFLRRNPRIWKFPLDGGEPQEIIGDPYTLYRWPSPSPDGSALYTHASYYTGSRFGSESSFHLRQIDLDTLGVDFVHDEARASAERSGKLHTDASMTTPRGENVMAPEVSPDGRFLAFARQLGTESLTFRGHNYWPRTALFVKDLASGEERKVMDPIETDISMVHTNYFSTVSPRYSWGPDSKTIFLAQGGKLRRLDVTSGDIETIEYTAHVQRTISEMARGKIEIDDEVFTIRFLSSPASARDGSKVAVAGGGRLWVLDGPDAEPRELTSDWDEGQEMSPAFSPDGSELAFVTWDDMKRGHVWKVAVDGGEPTRLTDLAGEYLYLDWHPDGSNIVLSMGPVPQGERTGDPRTWNGFAQPVGWQIALLPAQGGKPVEIAKTTFLQRPSFGADGRIYFQEVPPPPRTGGVRVPYPSEADENYRAIYRSVAPDGTDVREHVELKSVFSFMPVPRGQEPMVSPDGRWLAFQWAHQLYLVPMPDQAEDGGVPVIDPDATLPDPNRIRITDFGSFEHRWRDETTLEFTSGSSYFTYDVDSRELNSRSVGLKLPRDSGKGAVAFRGARIVSLATPGVIENGDLLVRNSRIECVGSCNLDGVDKIIDASGKTIVPGFMDMHDHISSDIANVLPRHRPRSALALAYGVTTFVDPAGLASGYLLSDLVEVGEIVGPRTFTTGRNMTGYDVHDEIVTLWDAERAVGRRVGWGSASVKNYLQNNRVQQQMTIEAARKFGITATSEGGNMQWSQLAQVMDGQAGFEHGLPFLPLYSDMAKFFGQARVVYSATIGVGPAHPQGSVYYFRPRHDFANDSKYARFVPDIATVTRDKAGEPEPKSRFSFPIMAEGIKDVVAAGGYAALGEHGEQPGIGTHWEMWSIAEAMEPIDVLKAASLHPAYFMGLEDELGTIEAGKIADLVVLDANPLEDIRNTLSIRYVMKQGNLYDGDTLDQLWPVERPFAPLPWE